MPDPKRGDGDEPTPKPEYDYEVIDDDADEIDFSDEAYQGDDRDRRPPPPGRRRPAGDRGARADGDRDGDDRGERRPRRRECPSCGDDGAPIVDKRISTGGWVLFAVLILFCTPLCFLPFVLDSCKEEVRRCGHCGASRF